MRLRTWLKKEPPAVSCRARVGSEDRVVEINMDDPRRWARTEETILAMGSSHVEALDKKGNVLRALDLEQLLEHKAEHAAAAGDDDDEHHFAALARVINEAHDAAAARHEGAYRMGFDLMAGITKQAVDAMVAVSRTNERLNKRLESFEPSAPATDEVPNVLIQGLIGRWMGAGGAGALPAGPGGETVQPAANGAGIPPEAARAFATWIAQQAIADAGNTPQARPSTPAPSAPKPKK